MRRMRRLESDSLGTSPIRIRPDSSRTAIDGVPHAKAVMAKQLLQRQIDATDRQIDRLEYELYGLTEEEIGIVEERI